MNRGPHLPGISATNARGPAGEQVGWGGVYAHVVIGGVAAAALLPATVLSACVPLTPSSRWPLRLLGGGLALASVAVGWWCVATALHRLRHGGRPAWYEPSPSASRSWAWVPLVVWTVAHGCLAWLNAGRFVGRSILLSLAARGVVTGVAEAVRWARRRRRPVDRSGGRP